MRKEPVLEGKKCEKDANGREKQIASSPTWINI
jgi:hypothetical protein